MTLPAHIEASLTEIESHFEGLSQALVSGEPQALEAASTALRQTALDFSQLLQRLNSTELQNHALKLRLKALSDGLVSRRETLIRRTVLVERELNAIVPATRSTTYAKSTGPYGSPAKQTGSFNSFSA
jgi:hypothetical protein